jgi:hypothetical protein
LRGTAQKWEPKKMTFFTLFFRDGVGGTDIRPL